MIELLEGQAYRLRYRSTLQELEREAVMVYLGRHGEATSWSARPAAGTQVLPDSWLVKVERTDSAERYVGRVMPRASER